MWNARTAPGNLCHNWQRCAPQSQGPLRCRPIPPVRPAANGKSHNVSAVSTPTIVGSGSPVLNKCCEAPAMKMVHGHSTPPQDRLHRCPPGQCETKFTNALLPHARIAPLRFPVSLTTLWLSEVCLSANANPFRLRGPGGAACCLPHGHALAAIDRTCG